VKSPLHSRRSRISAMLVACALVLLVSIVIGERLGDRVLRAATERRLPLDATLATPVAELDATAASDWKRRQVVAVATDPAFPDPRVTPPPAPTPQPRRSVTPPAPSPVPAPKGRYTSPPLPVPIISHAPGEVETEAPTEAPSPPPEP
jgi:hypothetical protein